MTKLSLNGKMDGMKYLFLSLFIFMSSVFCQENDIPNEQKVLQKMLDLVSKDRQAQKQATQWLATLNDLSVAPAFLDAMYLIRNYPGEFDKALQKITGQRIRKNWPRWMEWMGQQEIVIRPAYKHYKKILFSTIDREFGKFLDPRFKTTIRLDEIVWGGAKKDSIPALDNPKMIPAVDAEYLKNSDEIFGLSVNDEHHAYPLKILNWHEMLNITIGGKAVSLVYCTLCGAAIPYEGKVDGAVYTFGTSGLLYRSNKLMYDRQTNSLWSSLYGRPVAGPLAGKDIQLKHLYVVRTTWKNWREQHPNTLALDKNTGYDRDYRPGGPHDFYFNSDRTMFPIARRDERLEAKEWVFGLNIDSRRKAYPMKAFKNTPVINDTINGKTIVLIADAENYTVRAYAGGEYQFGEKTSENVIRDDRGDKWQVTEEALVHPSKQIRLPRLPGHLAFWFAWYAFYGDTEVWGKQ